MRHDDHLQRSPRHWRLEIEGGEMSTGRNRNQPCWCGSGKKYKNCHLNRAQEKRLDFWAVNDALCAAFTAKRCMAPEALHHACSGKIVRAHTVSRSGSLKRIAVDGHLYAFNPTLPCLSNSHGFIVPELRGIKQCSTFTGFCAHHDQHLFSPLENVAFDFSAEQCFLLAYRALARETFNKIAQASVAPILREADRGIPRPAQEFIQSLASGHQEGVQAGVTDAQSAQRAYDAVLLSRDFSCVRAYIVEFENVPSVMCATGLTLCEGFDGSIVQDLFDLESPAALIHCNALASGNGGAVVFTWLAESDPVCDPFIQTLEAVEDGDLTNALLRFFFEYSDNLQIAPAWWERLAQPAQQALLIRRNLAANVTAPRAPNCLAPDGCHYDDWQPLERYRLTPASPCDHR